MLPGGEICGDCEQEYRLLRDRCRLWPWFWGPFLLPWIFILLNLEGLWYGTTLNLPGRDMTGHPFSNAVIVTLFAALLLAGLTAGVRVWWLRRSFLTCDPQR